MKKIGLQPIPMMDRDKKDEVPQGQVRSILQLSTQHGIFSVSRCDFHTDINTGLQTFVPSVLLAT